MMAILLAIFGLMLLGVILLGIGVATNLGIIIGIGFVSLVGALVLYLVKWRCPECHRLLPLRGIRTFVMEFCPYCGEALDL